MYLTEDSIVPGANISITGNTTVYDTNTNEWYASSVNKVYGYFTDYGMELLREYPMEKILRNARVSKDRSNPNRLVRVSAPTPGGNTLKLDRIYRSDVGHRILWNNGIFHDIADMTNEGVCIVDGAVGDYPLSCAMIYNPNDTLVSINASVESKPHSFDYNGSLSVMSTTFEFADPIRGKVGLYVSESDTTPAAVLHFNQNLYPKGTGPCKLDISAATYVGYNNFDPASSYPYTYPDGNMYDAIEQEVLSDTRQDPPLLSTNRCWFKSKDAYITYIYSDQSITFDSNRGSMIPDQDESLYKSISVRAPRPLSSSSLLIDHIPLPDVYIPFNLPIRAYGISTRDASMCIWREIPSTPINIYNKSFYGYHFDMSYYMGFF